MKKVILVRHAKTIHHGYEADFDRYLTDRGIEQARTISKELHSSNVIPDLIVASPAVRTRQTAQIYASNLNYPADSIRYEPKLYDGMNAESFLKMISGLDDQIGTVLVVGHNPMVTFYLMQLVPSYPFDVPVCNTVVIRFEMEHWNELMQTGGRMEQRLFPDQFDL